MRPLPRIHLPKISLRDALSVVLPIALIVVAAFWVAYQFVRPAPPDSFVMSTGNAQGAYHAVAVRYQEILAREGITVELRPSAGSVENLERLADEASDVEAGLFQAGTGRAEDYPNLVSLGSVYFEPVWIFYRGADLGDQLRHLRDKRIAIDAVGSGTRALATQLLLVNRAWNPSRALDLGGSAAANALRQGSIDAAVLIGPPDSPAIRSLLLDARIKLMSFSRAAAYTKAFPFLSEVMLPEGAIDIMRNIPPRNVTLLAPTANVLVTEAFHPALADLMMEAMNEVHRLPGVFQKAGEFPAPRNADFPLSAEAERYYKSGPPFLQRYLPFWAATLASRILVLLVPLIAVLIPLMRVTPLLYAWRVRSRIYRWYGELKFLEHELSDRFDRAHMDDYLKRLNDLELRAYRRAIPAAFTPEVYTLRQHIDLVRGLLKRRTEEAVATDTAAGQAVAAVRTGSSRI